MSIVKQFSVVRRVGRVSALPEKSPCRRFPKTILHRALSLVAFLPVAFFSHGCWLLGSSQPPAPQNPTVPSRSFKSHSVQENPEYQAAVKGFSSGDKAAALRSLEALRRSPGLSTADLAFLDRQIAICQGKPTQNQATQSQGEKTGAAKMIPRSGKPVVGSGDCGPRALAIAAKELGVKADLAGLTKASGTTVDGTTLEGLVKGAKSIGLKAEGVQVDHDALTQLPTPAIAWWEGNHFVAVLKISENAFTGEVSALIHDPNQTKTESVKLADLLAKSAGIILTFKR